MKKQYEWKNGARFDIDAQPVGEALARLNGPTAEQIVEAAKDADSPLHGLFNWDIKSAAHEHWLATAQLIGRNITVTVTVENHGPIVVRAFETVDTGEDGGKCYVPVETVLTTEEYCEQVMSRIRGDLVSTQRELDNYSYLSGQMEKAAKRVKQAVKALA
ncbi:MAG: hypothetical protein IMZ71_05470 [Chloroflexi bacterium]|nr:hypothetical protein [Chloroflexota bacterium]